MILQNTTLLYLDWARMRGFSQTLEKESIHIVSRLVPPSLFEIIILKIVSTTYLADKNLYPGLRVK